MQHAIGYALAAVIGLSLGILGGGGSILTVPIFVYAMGQHAADWPEGKSVPQAMDILPRALTLQNIARYEPEVADPESVYKDPALRASYFEMYGNICFDSRQHFVNFPWSSERK